MDENCDESHSTGVGNSETVSKYDTGEDSSRSQVQNKQVGFVGHSGEEFCVAEEPLVNVSSASEDETDTHSCVEVDRKASDRAVEKTTANYKVGAWKHYEDRKLVELVAKYGPGNWSKIASGVPGRSGKSCRLRWHNQLSPDVVTVR